MTIGNNLKKCRMAKGLTQEQLAQRLHVTRQTVSSWERNNSHPDIEQLTAIAAALDTEVTVLLYGPLEPVSPTRRQILSAVVPVGLAVVAGVVIWKLSLWVRNELIAHSVWAYYYWGSYAFPLVALLGGLSLPALAGLRWRLTIPFRIRRLCLLAGGVTLALLVLVPPLIILIGLRYESAPLWLSQLGGHLLLLTYKQALPCIVAVLSGLCWGFFFLPKGGPNEHAEKKS